MTETTRFRHALLALMPYAESAPWYLRKLQSFVDSIVDTEGTVSSRAFRVRELYAFLVRERHLIPGHLDLYIELLEAVADPAGGPFVAESLAAALLERDGLQIVEPAEWSGEVELPSLVSRAPNSGRSETVSPESDPGRRWRSAFMRLQYAIPADVERMEVMDVDAGIRIVRNLALFVRPQGDTLDLARDRLAFFKDRAISVWDVLLRRRQDIQVEAEPRLGEGTKQLIAAHLLGRVRALSVPVVAVESGLAPRHSASGAGHIIVRGDIPEPVATDDREALKRYNVLKEPLPVAELPSLERIEHLASKLGREFPWATEAVRELVNELRARKLFGGIELGAPHTLLVGPPGCGKSRLVRRLSEELQLPFLPLSFAGMSDSRALLGTARGWSSAQASPLIDLLLSRKSASALVLVDEIDKAAGLTTNCVPPTVALLNLLEPENARQWYDSFLQTPCDLSKLMFWATANVLSPLSKPLLSRFRIVLVPEPRPEHFEVIAEGAMRDIAMEWGIPDGVLPSILWLQDHGRPRNAREIKAWARRRLHEWSVEHLHPSRVH